MTRRIALSALILSALLVQPASAAVAPAKAATGGPAVNTDLRCVLLAGLLAQNKDPQARNMASLMTFYYLGRADARGGQAPLATTLATQAKLIVPAEVNAAGQQCLVNFQTHGQALEAAMRANATPRPAAAPTLGPAAPAPATAPAPALK